MSKRKGVYDAAGLCASIGRRKYGAKKMAGMAKAGRRRNTFAPHTPKKYKVFNGLGGGQHSYHYTLKAALEKAKTVARRDGEADIHLWDGDRYVGYKRVVAD